MWSAGASPLAAVRTASQQPLPPILLAITYAAQLLYHHELASRYSSQAAAAAAAGAEPEQQQQQQQQGLVEPGILAAVLGGSSVSQEELEDAQRLMQEVQVRGRLRACNMVGLLWLHIGRGCEGGVTQPMRVS
jgi:hypothetical protein